MDQFNHSEHQRAEITPKNLADFGETGHLIIIMCDF